jgi:hypothetical protein
MVALSATDKNLIDAGVPFLNADQRHEWTRLATYLQKELAVKDAVSVPTQVAEIGFLALSALVDILKKELRKTDSPDQEEDHLFSDLEAATHTLRFIANDLGRLSEF